MTPQQCPRELSNNSLNTALPSKIGTGESTLHIIALGGWRRLTPSLLPDHLVVPALPVHCPEELEEVHGGTVEQRGLRGPGPGTHRSAAS